MRVYVPLKSFSIYNNFAEFLKIIGISPELLTPITEVTKYKEIIIPDECFFADEAECRFYTKEYSEMIDKIRNYALQHLVADNRYEKVYFSHAREKKLNQVGEKKLEKFFKNEGYTKLQWIH